MFDDIPVLIGAVAAPSSPMPAPPSSPSKPALSQAITAAFNVPIVLPKMRAGYLVSAVLAWMAAIILPLLYLMLPFTIGSLGMALLLGGAPMVRGIYSGIFVIGGGFGLLLSSWALLAPLFRRRRRTQHKPIVASAVSEPLLFQLIGAVAAAIGTRTPDEVHFTCEANAAIVDRDGRVILVLGLPLVATLSVKQLAGLLAHELGHVRQGGARSAITHVARVFRWFAAAVDDYDAAVPHPDPGVMEHMRDLSLAIGLRLLVLMIGFADGLLTILGRQMELDADRFEATIAGSASFAVTLENLCAADVVLASTVAASLRGAPCPDDLATWAARKLTELTVLERRRMARLLTKDAAGLPHPPYDERVDNVRSIRGTGLDLPEVPATMLFRSFQTYARRATNDRIAGLPIGRVVAIGP